jgi:hypothetical protein
MVRHGARHARRRVVDVEVEVERTGSLDVDSVVENFLKGIVYV